MQKTAYEITRGREYGVVLSRTGGRRAAGAERMSPTAGGGGANRGSDAFPIAPATRKFQIFGLSRWAREPRTSSSPVLTRYRQRWRRYGPGNGRRRWKTRTPS